MVVVMGPGVGGGGVRVTVVLIIVRPQRLFLFVTLGGSLKEDCVPIPSALPPPLNLLGRNSGHSPLTALTF